MSSERQQRAERIFQQALTHATEGRADWVRAACEDDRDLAAEVLELLGFHEATDAPLDRSPVVGQASNELAPGDQVGGYRILRKVGEGGMGAVYAAEQASPRRIIALKVILPGMATPAMLRRFEHEAHLLGLLEHPGIARVYEAGSAPGPSGEQLHFVAMEFISGTTLAVHAAQAKTASRELLSIFCLICDAVEYAHKRGVIHRDLKPANIMVTQEMPRVPKVLDFGVARLTAASIEQRLTVGTQRSLAVAGTVAYMSPEQIAARHADDIDTRSDVYSLGVILFELLSGSLPHDIGGSSFFEAARMIREEPPRSLLMLAPGTPSDLRTIVAKSLAKECSQRYQSAAELAADLRRYLSSEPILARSPSLFYQATRFTQRHRALVSVGASGLVALVGGLITTTIAYRRAQENQVLAEAAAEVSRREAAKANAIAAFFSEMLEGVGPMVAAGRDTQLLREILDSTSEQLPTRLKGDPQVQGILRRTISGVYRDLGEMQTAHSMAEESLRLLEGSMPPDSIEVATAVCTLASCATDIIRPEEAVTLAERARAIFASADAKGIAGGRRGVALCDMVIGDAHRVSGRPAEAAERYLAALPLLESAPDSPPLDKADAASGASLAYLDLGNGAKALEYAQRARDGLAAVYGERSIRVAYMDDQLGSAYYMLADPKASVRAHRAAVEVARHVLPVGNPRLGTMLSKLALALQSLGELAQAEALHEEAIAIVAAASAPDSQRLGVMYLNLAALQLDRGQFDKSLATAMRAKENCIKSLGDEHPRVTQCVGVVTNVLTLACRWAQAEESVRDEYARQLRLKKPDDPSLSPTRARMGQIFAERAWEKWVGATVDSERAQAHAMAAESVVLLKEAARAREATLPPGHWLRGNIHSLLGDAMVIEALSNPVPAMSAIDAAGEELAAGNAVIASAFDAVPPQHRERVGGFATLREARLAYARWRLGNEQMKQEVENLRAKTPEVYRRLIPGA